ncbi:MAG: capsule biosynthesis protein [Candidatus Scalindua sp. AMX11]|nr:MAG: capsule biosynthesis protein [Candidatus Scalindua sp.]NOG84147.1 capsule biosynthesis protein [Planctomycetota bacterium]RZV99003.1 MAG: capsule biosynthesis protein [Candidatus Scalindua sp. SCAELEC01]TDE66981.1 MAG: capsule biosynthesis protein [Candidatus Scalindua sp. AMX11]
MFKELIRNKPIFKKARFYYRWYRTKTTGYSDWNNILEKERPLWDAALAAAQQGEKILLATNLGAELAVTKFESLLGVALTLRGRDVHFLLCDSRLSACQLCTSDWYPDISRFMKDGPSKDLCKVCFSPAFKMYRKLGFTVHRYSDLLTQQDLACAENISSDCPLSEIEEYRLDGLAVGEHALAGALRFYARAELDGEEYAEGILRRYFKASLTAAFGIRSLLRKIRFDCVAMHHGIYVPQGLIGEVARDEKVRVVVWNVAYRTGRLLFSHDDTYHHTFISEPADKWENIEWGDEIEKELIDYLHTRWYGTQDWISFQDREAETDKNTIMEEVGIDYSKPCIGMLTNVMWDAQLHYPANSFPNMLEWIIQTIHYFSKRPELQLLIRVHPAEIRGALKSKQLVVDEVKKAFPLLPENVFVIPPESSLSTYSAMSLCNAVIIYGTKTGVELTSMGIPVIVAGEAWIRGKGVTLDAASPEEYFTFLDRLPLKDRLDAEIVTRARKYAYHFFFRRMIPLEFLEPTGGQPPFNISVRSLEDLMPGNSVGLDVICDGVQKGQDFIYPSEHHSPPLKGD